VETVHYSCIVITLLIYCFFTLVSSTYGKLLPTEMTTAKPKTKNSKLRRLYGLSNRQAQGLCLLLIALAFYSIPLELRPITTRGEGREGLMVRDMLTQSNFVLPLRLGNVVPSKPPMFHWLALITSQSLGRMTPGTLRLPSAICASLTLLFLYCFSSNSRGSAVGLASALVAASSLEWMRDASRARVDMCFSFFIVSSILLFFSLTNSALDRRKVSSVKTVLLGLSLAAGVLAKGPAGLLVPCIVVTFYFLLIRKEMSAKHAAKILLAPAIGLIISAIWYWLAFQQSRGLFFETQILRENFGRIFSSTGAVVGHEKGHFFALLDFLRATAPWSLFAPLVIVWVKRELPKLRDKTHRAELLSLLVIATFATLVLISRSKRPEYFLPCVPFFAHLLAVSCKQFILSANMRVFLRIMRSLTLLLGAVVGLLCASVLIISYLPRPDALVRQSTLAGLYDKLSLDVSLPLLLLSMLILTLIYLCKTHRALSIKDPFATLHYLAYSILIVSFGVSTLILPRLYLKSDPEGFSVQVRQELSSGRVLWQYDRIFYPLSFYLGHAPDILPRGAELPSALERTSLLVRNDQLEEVRHRFPLSTIIASSRISSGSRKHGMHLLRPLGR